MNRFHCQRRRISCNIMKRLRSAPEQDVPCYYSAHDTRASTVSSGRRCTLFGRPKLDGMMTRLDFDRLWVAPAHSLRFSLSHGILDLECGCREATKSPEHLFPTACYRVFLAHRWLAHLGPPTCRVPDYIKSIEKSACCKVKHQ